MRRGSSISPCVQMWSSSSSARMTTSRCIPNALEGQARPSRPRKRSFSCHPGCHFDVGPHVSDFEGAAFGRSSAWAGFLRLHLRAVPEHDRRDQQNIVVDEILNHERLDERGATPAIGGADALSKTLHVPRDVTTTIASYLPRGRSHSLGRRTSGASHSSVSSWVGALNRDRSQPAGLIVWPRPSRRLRRPGRTLTR